MRQVALRPILQQMTQSIKIGGRRAPLAGTAEIFRAFAECVDQTAWMKCLPRPTKERRSSYEPHRYLKVPPRFAQLVEHEIDSCWGR